MLDIKSAFHHCHFPPFWFSIRHEGNFSIHLQGHWEKTCRHKGNALQVLLYFSELFWASKPLTKKSPEKYSPPLFQLCFCLLSGWTFLFCFTWEGWQRLKGMSSVTWDELCEESGMEPRQSGGNWCRRHVRQPHARNLNQSTQLFWESFFFYYSQL